MFVRNWYVILFSVNLSSLYLYCTPLFSSGKNCAFAPLTQDSILLKHKMWPKWVPFDWGSKIVSRRDTLSPILFCGVQKILFPIDDFCFFFHKKKYNPLLLAVPPLSHLTSCTLTKSNLYLANSLTTAISDPHIPVGTVNICIIFSGHPCIHTLGWNSRSWQRWWNTWSHSRSEHSDVGCHSRPCYSWSCHTGKGNTKSWQRSFK